MYVRKNLHQPAARGAGGLGGMQSHPSRFKGVIGGESELPLCFATFAIKSRPARQGKYFGYCATTPTPQSNLTVRQLPLLRGAFFDAGQKQPKVV